MTCGVRIGMGVVCVSIQYSVLGGIWVMLPRKILKFKPYESSSDVWSPEINERLN